MPPLVVNQITAIEQRMLDDAANANCGDDSSDDDDDDTAAFLDTVQGSSVFKEPPRKRREVQAL